jgi:hypothetical protein
MGGDFMYFVPFEFTNYKSFVMETINKVTHYVDKNYDDLDKLYKLGKKKSYYIMFLIDCFGSNFLINYELASMFAERYADPEKERQNPLEILQRFYVDLFVKISEKSHFPKEEFFEKAFLEIYKLFMKDYDRKLQILKRDFQESSKEEIIEKLFKKEYDNVEDIIPTYNIIIFHSIHTDNKESSQFMIDIMKRAIKEHEILEENEEKETYSVENADYEKIKEENEFLKRENDELKSILKNVYEKLEQVI